MKRIPDGETGPRTSWVSRLRFVLEDNPSFEDDPQEVAAGGRITHPTEGTRTWKGSEVIVRGAPPPPRLRLKAGLRPQELPIGRAPVSPTATPPPQEPFRLPRPARGSHTPPLPRFAPPTP